jgi:hypothetical protein
VAISAVFFARHVAHGRCAGGVEGEDEILVPLRLHRWTDTAPPTIPRRLLQPGQFGVFSGAAGFFALGALFRAFLGFLARLGALSGCCCFPTCTTPALAEVACDAVGRLGAFGDPGFGLFDVDDEALLVILGEQRVVGADLLDEAAIAGRSASRRRRRCSTGGGWSRRGPDGFSGTLVYSLLSVSIGVGVGGSGVSPSPAVSHDGG